MTSLQNRYDFVLFFDVTNGNPNGDPDAGNLPRLDPETNQGLVSDVSIKRKIRNYVEASHNGDAGHRIYMSERAVLNDRHMEAWQQTGVEPVKKNDYSHLPREEAEARKLTDWMCANFFDIRSFGAVMTTGVNCGQVRGPVQITFARSEEPVLPLEISITRSSVTNERDRDKERTMGRKHIVPYGLYRAHGFINAKLAGKDRVFRGRPANAMDRAARHARSRPLRRARRDVGPPSDRLPPRQRAWQRAGAQVVRAGQGAPAQR